MLKEKRGNSKLDPYSTSVLAGAEGSYYAHNVLGPDNYNPLTERRWQEYQQRLHETTDTIGVVAIDEFGTILSDAVDKSLDECEWRESIIGVIALDRYGNSYSRSSKRGQTLYVEHDGINATTFMSGRESDINL